MNRLESRLLLAIGLVLAAAIPAAAENVDLVTLPGRDAVELTIYNSEDVTLVRETRALSLKKGNNRLQFSWAGTLIDPTSVELRILEHVDEVEVVDTVYPGQKPEALFWNVESSYEGQVTVEVKYFTSGITWAMDYVAVTDAAEQRMDLRGHVRVYNSSGAAYDDASIRLIVGNINLVEKIAQLAQRRGLSAQMQQTETAKKELRSESLEAAMDRAAPMLKADRKEIVKEGLSEYFMFTIEGQESVPNGWSKRIQAVESTGMEFDILYRMRAHQYGPRPVRFFLWQNDTAHGLGGSPLPDGTVRVFRANTRDGLSYLGAQLLRYVPVQAEIEVNLGVDDLVVYETRKTGTGRSEFSFRNDSVIGWHELTSHADTIRNYRPEPIRFELRRLWEGDIEYASPTATTLFDYRTVEVALELPARSSQSCEASVLQRHGEQRRQDRIELK